MSTKETKQIIMYKIEDLLGVYIDSLSKLSITDLECILKILEEKIGCVAR